MLNYLPAPAQITLRHPMKDLLTGETLDGECTLPAYGVFVLEL